MPIGETCTSTGVEPTVKAFWGSVSASLAELLSHWLRLRDGERQACDGPELARNAQLSTTFVPRGLPGLTLATTV